MSAPIILSMLGNRTRSQDVDAGGLGGMLGRELQDIGRRGQGGLLSSVFDQDGDGELGLGDLLKVGVDMLGSRGRT